MLDPASRAGKGRGALVRTGVALGLVLLALIAAGRAAAHENVIDFRQTCSGHRADGHNHADTIYGSRTCQHTRDTFRGLWGPDRIYGYFGDDILLKGAKGDDFVYGGRGQDWVEGSDGADTLGGGRGADHIEGGLDGDQIRAGGDDDRIYGQEGNDIIRGGPGADLIDCGSGEDEAWGLGGNDRFTDCEIRHE
jgi:Ca2+-binding RTX toxin-like protein